MTGNVADVLRLLYIPDELAVGLVKFHVFSTIRTGGHNPGLAMAPPEWVDFCDRMCEPTPQYGTSVWYQPT